MNETVSINEDMQKNENRLMKMDANENLTCYCLLREFPRVSGLCLYMLV